MIQKRQAALSGLFDIADEDLEAEALRRRAIGEANYADDIDMFVQQRNAFGPARWRHILDLVSVFAHLARTEATARNMVDKLSDAELEALATILRLRAERTKRAPVLQLHSGEAQPAGAENSETQGAATTPGADADAPTP